MQNQNRDCLICLRGFFSQKKIIEIHLWLRALCVRVNKITNLWLPDLPKIIFKKTTCFQPNNISVQTNIFPKKIWLSKISLEQYLSLRILTPQKYSKNFEGPDPCYTGSKPFHWRVQGFLGFKKKTEQHMFRTPKGRERSLQAVAFPWLLFLSNFQVPRLHGPATMGAVGLHRWRNHPNKGG